MEQKNEKPAARDNTTSQSAALYDANVEKTIPRYSQFYPETLDLVGAVIPNPSLWLDTGCGTGNLAAKAGRTVCRGEVYPQRFLAGDAEYRQGKVAGHGRRIYSVRQ